MTFYKNSLYIALVELNWRYKYIKKYLKNIVWLICYEINQMSLSRLRIFGVPILVTQPPLDQDLYY